MRSKNTKGLRAVNTFPSCAEHIFGVENPIHGVLWLPQPASTLQIFVLLLTTQ